MIDLKEKNMKVKTIPLNVLTRVDFLSSSLFQTLTSFVVFDLDNLKLDAYRNIITGIYQPSASVEPGISQAMIERLLSTLNFLTL